VVVAHNELLVRKPELLNQDAFGEGWTLRMHLTLKKEATRPPGANSLQQQHRFDAFVQEFNAERPHEALDMKCPAELYVASPRRYDGLPELTYPFHDRDCLRTALPASQKDQRLYRAGRSEIRHQGG
jgi:hypothetical protein